MAPRLRWNRRKVLTIGAVVVVGWLALSHFVVRRSVEAWLSRHFAGESKVAFALLWPHLDATAFGVTVKGETHVLHAERVYVDASPLSALGGRLVKGIGISGFEADVEGGKPLRLFREPESEGAAVEDDANLDPVWLPRVDFWDPVLRVGYEGRDITVFTAGGVQLLQRGDAVYELATRRGGVVAGVPYEKLTGRLMPHGNRLMLGTVKLRTFNGLVAGFVDVDLGEVGVFNGEAQWFMLEAEKVWRTYGLPYAEKRRGDLSGRMVFSGDSFTLRGLSGKGQVTLEHGDFFSPLSFKVFLVLKVPSAQEAPVNRGRLQFSFERGLAYLEHAKFFAREFDLEGRGLVSFQGKIDMEIGHGGTTVSVSGKLEDPTIRVLPLDAVLLPFERMFRERVER
ncbi:MAG: AsmA family protein [Planctomycetota bacterium]|jgi:hypothetical protein